MKQKLRQAAAAVTLLAALTAGAFPASAAETITTQMTMGQIWSDPGVAGCGVWIQSKFRDVKELQKYYFSKQTLLEYVGPENAEASAEGLNLLVEAYESGIQVTYPLYSEEEIAADPSKKVSEVNFFPATQPNAKFALVLCGNSSTRTAELKECIGTAAALHDKGYAVFTLRYRVFQDASDNAPLDDMGRALQFITANAEVFGVQPEHYALVGYSSGGHLAGLFGSRKLGWEKYGVPEPAALLLGYPINDFNEVRPLYKLMMDPLAAEKRYYQYTVSGSVEEGYPAVFFWNGENDTTLKLLDASKQEPTLEKALQQYGIPYQRRVYKNAAHGSALGIGTDAEGWLDEAVAFWEEQIS